MIWTSVLIAAAAAAVVFSAFAVFGVRHAFGYQDRALAWAVEALKAERSPTRCLPKLVWLPPWVVAVLLIHLLVLLPLFAGYHVTVVARGRHPP